MKWRIISVKKKYGEYLPVDFFDYEAHLVVFWGANWG